MSNSSIPRLADQTDRQPPLGIIHLMLWMLGTAMVLGLAMRSRLDPVFYTTICRVLFALLFGAGFASVLLWLGRLVRGGPRFPVSPGHWLLWLIGWEVALQVALKGLLHLDLPTVVRDVFRPIAVEGLALMALTCVVVRFCPGPRWWLVAWLLLVTSHALDGSWGLLFVFNVDTSFMWERLLWSLLFTTQPWAIRLAYACVCIAVAFDRRYSLQRDWLHWTGVVVWLSRYWLQELQVWVISLTLS